MRTYLRPAALQKAVMLSEIWNILVWGNHTEPGSSFKMARSFSWGNSSNDSVLDIFQNCQFTDKTHIQQRRSQIGGEEWVSGQATGVYKLLYKWVGRAKLYGVGLLNYNATEIQQGIKQLWIVNIYIQSILIKTTAECSLNHLFLLSLCFGKAEKANEWRLYVQSTAQSTSVNYLTC